MFRAWTTSLALVLVALCSSVAVLNAADVVDLTDDNFDELVLANPDDVWVVEFYAPWCGHCKKLAPVLDEAAREIGDKIKIGKVDATANSQLKSKYDVSFYPKLTFFRDGEMNKYRGGRAVVDFVRLADRLSGPAVTEVNNMDRLNDMVDASEYLFVLGASKDLSDDELKVFEDVASANQDQLTFVKITDAGLLSQFEADAPFLAKLEVGEPAYFFNKPIQQDTVAKWIEVNSFPLFPKLGIDNYKPIGETGQLMVVAALKPASEEDEKPDSYVNMIRKIARHADSPVEPSAHEKFNFVWLDGEAHEEYLKKYFVSQKSLPTIFVLDQANDMYYIRDDLNDVKSIKSFMEDIASGEAEGNYMSQWKGAPQRAYKLFMDELPYSLVVLLPIGALFAFIYVCILHLTASEEEVEEEKEGKEKTKTLKEKKED